MKRTDHCIGNIMLNKAKIWKNTKCVLCGRKYPKTLLNIEGIIHHNCSLRCLLDKDCKRAQRKLKKGKS